MGRKAHSNTCGPVDLVFERRPPYEVRVHYSKKIARAFNAVSPLLQRLRDFLQFLFCPQPNQIIVFSGGYRL